MIHESKLQHGLLKIRSGARKMKIQDINSEEILNEANPADVKRMFAKQLSSTNKLMSIIKQSLGYLEKRHKGDPGNVQNLLFLSGIRNKLSNVEQDINKFPRK